jgi:Zn-dependent membrane protease YugP
MLFHWTLILLIPAVIVAIWAQAKVMGAYRRWSQVRDACGMTGAQVAMDMMRRAELLAAT